MTTGPLTIFGMEGSLALARSVVACLDLPLGLIEERHFEDGEHKSRPLQEVRGQDVFVLLSLHGDERDSGNDKLCRLLFFCGALSDSGARAGDRCRALSLLCQEGSPHQAERPDHHPLRRRDVRGGRRSTDVIGFEVHNLAAFENAFRCPTLHIPQRPPVRAALCRGAAA